MIYTGEAVDAATAERIGLVNVVVPADRLLEEAKTLARKILEKSPATIALAKACLRAAQEMPLSQGLSYETAAFAVAGATQDKVEGMTAFLEKRKPIWKGA
jgi:enoyl-CoA hydratase